MRIVTLPSRTRYPLWSARAVACDQLPRQAPPSTTAYAMRRVNRAELVPRNATPFTLQTSFTRVYWLFRLPPSDLR